MANGKAEPEISFLGKHHIIATKHFYLEVTREKSVCNIYKRRVRISGMSQKNAVPHLRAHIMMI